MKSFGTNRIGLHDCDKPDHALPSNALPPQLRLPSVDFLEPLAPFRAFIHRREVRRDDVGGIVLWLAL
ncbi:protein of unknown function [Candidatus Methylomirabilis oxygeniifera]|uniref:Uncharacterized protein n=1 Tax=Methylomirabilis oxygeniifera TaxID=671143 RepID=D5MGU4_METO1|nr:protein of unknown function [Candidatus Methylomirabilis oxyfera]